jgi:hypothetical protein
LPDTRKILYEILEENAEYQYGELSTLMQPAGLNESMADRAIWFILYYGMLRLRKPGDEP